MAILIKEKGNFLARFYLCSSLARLAVARSLNGVHLECEIFIDFHRKKNPSCEKLTKRESQVEKSSTEGDKNWGMKS